MTVQTKQTSYPQIIPVTLVFCALSAVMAFVLDTPANALAGLKTIVLTPDTLITDYMALAGPGGAFLNCALTTLAVLLVLVLSGAPLNGPVCGALGLVSGFSLFGKDIANIWPILLGGWLYSRFRKESFGKYSPTVVMATTLAPAVSALWFSGNGVMGFVGGTFMGMVIGFLVPVLSSYTMKIQKGMNFYNIGFACGLLALMLVPLLVALHLAPETQLYWSTEYTRPLAVFLFLLCGGFLVLGTFFAGASPREAWSRFFSLMKQKGRSPSDYLVLCGGAPVLINMGVCGLISTGYILLIGGDLNGPTISAIFSIMGFAAWGKHPRNMVPVIFGAASAALVMPRFHLTDSVIQFSALFSSTLSPITGSFGWPFGILAGFLHICLVQRTSAPVCGLNLYNNGFTGGLVALVLYGILAPLGRIRDPEERDQKHHAFLP